MKLHSTVQDQAILSNVGEVGEFRIRNSAKAFNILSSGLYANKIRAVIRELSCNAVDSHVAAGRADVPFEVHLPTDMEPHFAVRDFGTGLTHEQVTNIYTTYFESTKTASNEFIGALGLGSKSPFSYTDNFTVTAIRDGRKGIYTAFINDQGVPSIALMTEHAVTDELPGVEVRFGVSDRYDFEKFRREAAQVYTHFSLRPKITGPANFKFIDPSYTVTDIIPGVHQTDDTRTSVAVMGNIAYPIDVPNSEQNLGDLSKLLRQGLVMHFDIGELDFQASREGLSYIPQTIESIKKKLDLVASALTVKLAADADAIKNEWERALFLESRYTGSSGMWSAAVSKYLAQTKFDLYSLTNTNSWLRLASFNFDLQTLASKYNIDIKAFKHRRYNNVCEKVKPNVDYDRGVIMTPTTSWKISVRDSVWFIVNDTKVGATERAKYFFRTKKDNKDDCLVYVLEPVDKTKPVAYKEFLAAIRNPNATTVKMVSSLPQKPRTAGVAANVTIMRLEENRRNWRSRGEMVWRDGGKADNFDTTATYYYLPLSGFACLGKVSDVKELYWKLHDSGLYTGEIYGVRKTDIEWVKKQKNWVNLDTHVETLLKKVSSPDMMGMIKKTIDWDSLYEYNAQKHLTNPASPYLELYNEFKDVKVSERSNAVEPAIRWLSQQYNIVSVNNVNVNDLVVKYNAKRSAVVKRYPLLKSLRTYDAQGKDVAQYINLIDSSLGV